MFIAGNADIDLGGSRLKNLGAAVDGTDANQFQVASGRLIYDGVTALDYVLDPNARDFVQLTGNPTPSADDVGDIVFIKT